MWKILESTLANEISILQRTFSAFFMFAAAGNWPDIEYAHAMRFSKLMEYYQDVVLVDKQDKQDYSRRMTPKKHKFASLTVSTNWMNAFI